MSDVGVFDGEHDAPSLRPRRTFLGIIDHLNQTFIALLAATAVVALVLVVTLLMAFIEYQSRLLRYQPGIRSSEIMQAARREIDAEEAENKEQDATKALMKAAENLARSTKEAQFLAERVCSVFIAPGEPDQRRRLCYDFLGRVPFDGTIASPVPEVDSPAHPQNDVRVRWDSFNKAVLAGFVRAMAAGRPQAVDTDYLSVFSADIVRIARLNQEIFTKLALDVEQQRNAYQVACLKKVELNALNTYFDAPPANCLVWSSERAATSPPPSPPLPLGGGASANPLDASQPDSGSPNGGAEAGRKGVLSGNQLPLDPDRMEKQRRFELVRQFRIYNDFTLGIAKHLLLSPPDYLASWLLIFGGALGSMLKIVFRHLMPTRTVKWSDLLVDSAQGLVCAMILFILFRSGVVVISGPTGQSNDATPLSPYFVAFLAIGAGLMSDQVINAFRSAAGALIGTGATRQPNRWAVGLAEALDAQAAKGRAITEAEIAARLGVVPMRVREWRNLKASVEAEYQDALRLVLGTALHKLFTDIDPRTAPAPAPLVSTTGSVAQQDQALTVDAEPERGVAEEPAILSAGADDAAPAAEAAHGADIADTRDDGGQRR